MRKTISIPEYVNNSNKRTALAYCKGKYFYNDTWITEDELEALLPIKYDSFIDPKYKGENPDFKRNYLHGAKSF